MISSTENLAIDQMKNDKISAPVLNFVLENIDGEIVLDDLAGAAGISKFALSRYFKKKYGLTPMKWIWTLRTVVAERFLRRTANYSLTDVAFSCGFSSSAHFSRLFSQVIGVAPSKIERSSHGNQSYPNFCDIHSSIRQLVFAL